MLRCASPRTIAAAAPLSEGGAYRQGIGGAEVAAEDAGGPLLAGFADSTDHCSDLLRRDVFRRSVREYRMPRHDMDIEGGADITRTLCLPLSVESGNVDVTECAQRVSLPGLFSGRGFSLRCRFGYEDRLPFRFHRIEVGSQILFARHV